jgi:prophage tail gpP-like protein
MSGSQPQVSNPTQRITLKVAGQTFSKFTKMHYVGDLKEISSSIELEYVDEGRLAETLQTLISPPPYFRVVKPGMACTLALDGETIFVGWIEVVEGHVTPDAITTKIIAKDICGDLVECAAAPNGPAEYKNIDLLHFATAICAPFKIGVQAQTDIGAAFPVLAVSPHDKAMAAIEKVSRQRAVLVTSDGVANLVLTTAGSTRAPAGITMGVNATMLKFKFDHSKRFSDIYVKGQTARANGNHSGIEALITPTTAPTGETAGPPASATQAEAAGILMTGHAHNPEITRWRPDVRMVRTQSGSDTVQVQAEWHVRVDRALSTPPSYGVVDWRAGPNNALWRRNQLTAVYDPFAGIDDDMLIAKVEFFYDEEGARTELHCVGKAAFDRVNEASRSRPRHAATSTLLDILR